MSTLHNLRATLCDHDAMVDVAQLLAQPELALVACHLPKPDAEVRWVATSELDDPAPFLEGGELLLTTGLATKGWRGQWAGYVGRLAEAGVVALALGVGLTHRRAPAGLVRACEKHGLNLIEVPRPTPFVAVSRAVAALLEDERDQVARRSLDAQRALTRAALERDDVQSLVAVLAAQVNGAAATVTRDGMPVERAGELDASLVRAEVSGCAISGCARPPASRVRRADDRAAARRPVPTRGLAGRVRCPAGRARCTAPRSPPRSRCSSLALERQAGPTGGRAAASGPGARAGA